MVKPPKCPGMNEKSINISRKMYYFQLCFHFLRDLRIYATMKMKEVKTLTFSNWYLGRELKVIVNSTCTFRFINIMKYLLC